MSATARLLRFALPCGIAAFCWLTLRTVIRYGAESSSSFGFPWPWVAPSNASSMAWDVALVPLCLDLLLYVAAAQLVLLAAWRRRPGRQPWRRGVASAAAFACWSVAFGSVAVMAALLAGDTRVAAWTPERHFPADADRQRSIHLGLPSWP